MDISNLEGKYRDHDIEIVVNKGKPRTIRILHRKGDFVTSEIPPYKIEKIHELIWNICHRQIEPSAH